VTVAETSLQAFKQKKKDGSLSQDQETIYKLVKKEGPITCKETARMLRKTPNQISGRFTELLDKNLIQITGHRDGHRLYEVKKQ
jgi:predicted HTH transcriptional regulator